MRSADEMDSTQVFFVAKEGGFELMETFDRIMKASIDV